ARKGGADASRLQVDHDGLRTIPPDDRASESSTVGRKHQRIRKFETREERAICARDLLGCPTGDVDAEHAASRHYEHGLVVGRPPGYSRRSWCFQQSAILTTSDRGETNLILPGVPNVVDDLVGQPFLIV